MLYIESLDDFETRLKEVGDKLVVVDFFADWCGPCRMIAPKFEEFEKTYTNVLFWKVNVDEASDITDKYNVSAMPTFLFFKNEKQVSDVVGANANKVEEKIKELQ